MAMSDHLEEAVAQGDFDGDNTFSARNWKSEPESVLASDFDCSICLGSVRDPVVTLCGHLYCWACIYKWLRLHSISTGAEDQRHKQCPVCKAEVSLRTLVPLYGKGQTTIRGEDKDIPIPRRPVVPVCRYDMSRSLHASGNRRLSERIHLNYPHAHGTGRGGYNHPVLSTSVMSSSPSTVIDPLIIMIGDLVCTMLFGTELMDTNHSYLDGYSIGPRMRRQMMQADKSLSRICFFLMCCVILCLLVF